MGILWDRLFYELIRLAYKHSFVVSKKIRFSLPVSTHTEEYLSHTARKDLSGIDDEYLHVSCVGYSVSNTFVCSFSKGDHRVKHLSFRNVTSFGQILRFTRLYLCL